MNILDIFYNYVIREAATGRVYCGFYYNIFFETYFEDTKEIIKKTNCSDKVITPVLNIKNKELFNELLIKYVELSLDFYQNLNINLKDIDNKEDIKKYKICKEKIILTLLWSNATYDDFREPVEFLRKRIAFLESNIGEISHKFEYSPMLEGNIELEIKKDHIYNETPYKMTIKSINKDEKIYEFPEIKFGIIDNTVYIYAIQNKKIIENDYYKRINRILYKVGEGFNLKEDNFEIYEEGNLNDISPSFLVSLNMAIAYFYNLGITKIMVPNILISRWNAKKLGLQYLTENRKIEDSKIEDLLKEQDRIQKNLTEKFLRIFLRLKYHYDNIHIENIPFDLDSFLHLSIDGELISNNKLLNETAGLVKIDNKNRII